MKDLIKMVWEACEECGVSEAELVLGGHALDMVILEEEDAPDEDIVRAAKRIGAYLSMLSIGRFEEEE